MDRTFVMIKPDGVQRGIIGAVISRLEAKGLKLVAANLTMISEEKVMEHYAEHVAKPFFPSLKEYIMSGPVVAMVWEGKGSVAIVRKLVGATNPADAAPGTIRGDMAMETGKNVIHASDSDESAAREIAIHFADAEFVAYARLDEPALYE
ncbi:nucleoside-diphosphate kinase [Methanofollis tationis]|uniref:Nucleoside diphosphate kinase n=1 Tax=Methanofollis tationis TaxID=81417 RepID=A0A7K4HS59_9EURY|nr:nucleoside-diphosphate kinase [Methanofollis tationis]NVO67887.1 nucleoside-diphosphate kinase [Methanofollis tationis]